MYNSMGVSFGKHTTEQNQQDGYSNTFQNYSLKFCDETDFPAKYIDAFPII